MGFLDHSTNNIIVDAVLTDIGRKKLAEGTFVISKFALGDDEVDYNIIKKFGRTVGKEKIEKNTPVFEAQTNADLGLKNKLLTVSNPYLTKLPYLQSTSLVGADNAFRGTSVTMTIAQLPDSLFSSSTATGATDVRDTAFNIEYDARFLALGGTGASSIGSNNIVQARRSYSGQSSTGWGAGFIEASFTIVSFSDSYFSYYSSNANNDIITTYVEFAGVFSGQRLVVPITIKKSS